MHIKIAFTFFLVLFLSATALHAQNNRQLSLDLNRSFHGTGDMKGVGFSVEYGKYITRRLELTGSIGANVHNDHYFLYRDLGGRIEDASYRMVTGGIQLAGQAHFALVRTGSNEFKIGLGPLIRYQSSNASGGYGIIYPIVTNYPEPLFNFYQIEDQNIVTVGVLASASYAYTFRSKLFIGAKGSFQTDTNGDVVIQYGLRIGRRF